MCKLFGLRRKNTPGERRGRFFSPVLCWSQCWLECEDDETAAPRARRRMLSMFGTQLPTVFPFCHEGSIGCAKRCPGLQFSWWCECHDGCSSRARACTKFFKKAAYYASGQSPAWMAIPSTSVSTRRRPTFPLEVTDAGAASRVGGAVVITWETVSSSSKAATSSSTFQADLSFVVAGHHFQDGVTLVHSNDFPVGFPTGPVELNGELVGSKAREPAARNPGVCSHEVPPVMPPAIQVSGERIVLTCVMALLDIDLQVSGEPHPAHQRRLRR